MSIRTSVELRKLFIYQVYLRSHTKSGTIQEFIGDLNRIKNLGTDVVYFLPIHPIGKVKRKGTLGCPYSIQDYRAINPEYGTHDDFQHAIEEIHNRDMKVMIDVVYNHTSHDSVLLQEHPEYFLHENGSLVLKEPSWSDIQDFDYTIGKPLWDELVDTLLFWMKKGVDGFRFDVTSFLPLEFLLYAERKMRNLNPNVILLSESVHGGYLRHMRNKGYQVISESEIYQAFDMAYDYDIHQKYESYLLGKGTLNRYLEAILHQEEIYPQNYIKMRNLENHDYGRFAAFVQSDPVKIDNWTAFNFFEKGSAMVYAGQEFCDTRKPSLFEKEDVQWDGKDISPLIQKLSNIMKYDHLVYGIFDIHMQNLDAVCMTYQYQNEIMVGIFNVGNVSGSVHVPVKNGVYQNLLSETKVTIHNHTIELSKEPIIFVVK